MYNDNTNSIVSEVILMGLICPYCQKEDYWMPKTWKKEVEGVDARIMHIDMFKEHHPDIWEYLELNSELDCDDFHYRRTKGFYVVRTWIPH